MQHPLQMSVVVLALVTCFLSLLTPGRSQLMRQCSCDELEPCQQQMVYAAEGCADSCKSYLGTLSNDVEAMKRCVLQRKPQIDRAWQCIYQQAHSQQFCSTGWSNRQLPFRSFDDIKEAQKAQMRQTMPSTLFRKMKPAIDVLDQFFDCSRQCIETSSGHCFTQLGCALDLPSNDRLIEMARSCAVRSGFNYRTTQSLCQCLARTVPGNLKSTCSMVSQMLTSGSTFLG